MPVPQVILTRIEELQAAFETHKASIQTVSEKQEATTAAQMELAAATAEQEAAATAQQVAMDRLRADLEAQYDEDPDNDPQPPPSPEDGEPTAPRVGRKRQAPTPE